MKNILKIIGIVSIILLIILLIIFFILGIIRSFKDEKDLLNNYNLKVFAGNQIYWCKEQPKKVNENCWLIKRMNSEIFYCGDIYVIINND